MNDMNKLKMENLKRETLKRTLKPSVSKGEQKTIEDLAKIIITTIADKKLLV